jgi:hypothetical protein
VASLTPADGRLIATAAVFDITKNVSADPDNSGFVGGPGSASLSTSW